jgi:antitoxin (DNA-binding transcriptional repressor) of toxin-antitoxin stability system
VTITKHGRPVARLVPVERTQPATETIAALRQARQGIRLGRVGLRRLIDEGRA